MESEGPRYLKDKDGYFSQEQRDRTKKRSKEMESSVSSTLKKQRNRPRSMAYFDEVHKYGGARYHELKEFHDKGGKIVGTLCVMVPLELIFDP